MDATEKHYLKISGTWAAVYIATVAISVHLLRGHERTLLGYYIALLPIVPAIFAALGFMRRFRSLDDCSAASSLKPWPSASSPPASSP